MHEALEILCEELEELADFIEKSWGDDRTLLEAFGWNCAAVTRHDLADMPRAISGKIRTASPDVIHEDLEKIVTEIPNRIESIKKNTVPQLYNNNSAQATSAYFSSISWIEMTLEPLISWQENNDNKLLPPNLSRSLRSIRSQIDQLTPDKDDLTKRINLIKEATEAAESLPTDLQTLIEARKKVSNLSNEAIKLHTSIEKNKSLSELYITQIKASKGEADKLVEQCEEAYRITTTKGLAAGFDQRAAKLSTSMWVWVGGLVISLIVGAVLGTLRISSLSEALSGPDPQLEIILIHTLLSFLSIGAPLWFAWVSTKQLGQRFRLAEDYAFKASVAKAYEGYRREAARIDESFEARLFSSALSRLEEAPLRLVDNENHGSPWQELISSKQFQAAMNTIPELKDKFLEISKRGLESMTADRRTPKAVNDEQNS
jgi:hypothetical protein